jgi:hypothetical protein
MVSERQRTKGFQEWLIAFHGKPIKSPHGSTVIPHGRQWRGM